MLTTIAKVWGWIFLIVGILGFVPAVAPNGHLLGIFDVNGPHNFVHLATGIVALICGYQNAHVAKLYFLIFGIVYGLVALLGFVAGNSPVLGIIANNIADAWLHVGIAVVSIALGLMPETTRATTRMSVP
ncbi:MAG: rane protein [Verrucomicrobiales bacterium]|nr:rane protein [Verrucomicrobiales bacterium]